MAASSAHQARHVMLGTSGPMQRPARASFLPFGIQWFHRAEATAVFVGQVARVLRIADDHRRQQDDHLAAAGTRGRSEEHTSELQSLMRNSYAVFCLKKKTNKQKHSNKNDHSRNNKKD